MKLCQEIFVSLGVAVTASVVLACPVLAAPIDLSLNDCVVRAMKNNQVVKIADFDRQQSIAAVQQAQSSRRINITFNHSDKRYDTYNAHQLYVNGIKEYEWINKDDNLFTLNWPLYTGHKLEAKLDAAKLNLEIAGLNVDATKQQLKQTVTFCYFGVLQSRNHLAVQQLSVDNYARHLETVQARFEEGAVAKYDVLASQVSLANAQNNLIKAQNSYALALANLNNVIGLPLNSELTLNEELAYAPYAQTLEACEQYALLHRPEMAQQEAKVAIASDDVEVARSGYRPTIDFSATQNWYHSSVMPGSYNGNWSVGLTAAFNVFDSGVTAAKVDQAKFALGSAQTRISQNRDSILLEVRQSYLNLREAEARIETNKVAVARAEESLRVAKTRYNAGVGTNLDVLDAVLSLNTAKTNHTQALYDYNVSRAQLDKVMGVPVQ